MCLVVAALFVFFTALDSAKAGLITVTYKGTVISTGGVGFEVPTFQLAAPFRSHSHTIPTRPTITVLILIGEITVWLCNRFLSSSGLTPVSSLAR
jgi:hypothetical protein